MESTQRNKCNAVLSPETHDKGGKEGEFVKRKRKKEMKETKNNPTNRV